MKRCKKCKVICFDTCPGCGICNTSEFESLPEGQQVVGWDD